MAATVVDADRGRTSALIAAVRRAFGSAFSISRGYIAGHDGIDLAAKEGTPVYAVATGIVEYAADARIDPNAGRAWALGGGNVVNIAIGNRQTTQYAHLSKITVRKGTMVRKGDLIGYVGRTGGVDSHGHYGGAGSEFVGSHLHFGLWDKRTNRMVNPTAFLAATGGVTPNASPSILEGWLGVVKYPEGTPITAAMVDDIMAKLYKAGYFDGPAGAIAAVITKDVLTQQIGKPWNKATQDAIAGQAHTRADEATAVPNDLGAPLATIAGLATALMDPSRWLYILALIAGAAMAAFGGINVLRAAA